MFPSWMHHMWIVTDTKVYFNDRPVHDYRKACVLDIHENRYGIRSIEDQLQVWKEKNFDVCDRLRKKYTPNTRPSDCTFYLECLGMESEGPITKTGFTEWCIRTNSYLMTRENGDADTFYVKERLER